MHTEEITRVQCQKNELLSYLPFSALRIHGFSNKLWEGCPDTRLTRPVSYFSSRWRAWNWCRWVCPNRADIGSLVLHNGLGRHRLWDFDDLRWAQTRQVHNGNSYSRENTWVGALKQILARWFLLCSIKVENQQVYRWFQKRRNVVQCVHVS